MPDLRPIPDDVYAEAGAVMAFAAGTGPLPDREVVPGFEMMVAGTATALAEGAPNAFSSSRESKPFHYLAMGSEEYRHFQPAVARAIDLHRTGEQSFETPGDFMRHMASDVLMQTEARSIWLAATNTDPAFRAGMTPSRLDTVAYVASDPEALSDMRARAAGFYSTLDEYVRRDLAGDMMNGQLVTPSVDAAIVRAERLIEREQDMEHDRSTMMRLALGDFSDFDTPLHRHVLPKHEETVSRLLAGEEKPWNWSEQGIVAHAALDADGALATLDDDSLRAAYARELARGENAAYDTTAHAAMRIEADIVMVHRAQRDVATAWVDGLDPSDGFSGLVASGRPYSELPAEHQVSVYERIETHRDVPPLVALRLMVAGEQAEKGELLVGRMKEEAARVITYEGIDVSDQDARWREDLYLPGDRVRLDPKARIVGVDHDALTAKVGEEPLVVSRTVVEGEQRDNTLGGTYQVALNHYEFKGVEGRFPAGAFQHERGDEHHYGVLMEQGEKLWFVPLCEDLDNPKATGPAREVATVLESSHVGSMAVMRDLVGQDPANGEFVVRPEAYGRKDGPVELVGAPWMSSASGEETAVARASIAEVAAPPPAMGRAAGIAHAASMGR